jgi:hypothetical protein
MMLLHRWISKNNSTIDKYLLRGIPFLRDESFARNAPGAPTVVVFHSSLQLVSSRLVASAQLRAPGRILNSRPSHHHHHIPHPTFNISPPPPPLPTPPPTVVCTPVTTRPDRAHSETIPPFPFPDLPSFAPLRPRHPRAPWAAARLRSSLSRTTATGAYYQHCAPTLKDSARAPCHAGISAN